MPSRLSRLLAATGLAATVLLAVAACSAGIPGTAPTTAAAAAPESTAQLGDGPGATTPAASPAKSSGRPAPVLADGRWPGLIAKVGDGSVALDLVEFLTGDAAAKEYKKRFPDHYQESSAPDDYFVVNDNTRLRTLPLASSVEVLVAGDTGPEADTTIPAGDLTAHFGEALDDTIFWLTVEQGAVTRIEQQYVP